MSRYITRKQAALQLSPQKTPARKKAATKIKAVSGKEEVIKNDTRKSVSDKTKKNGAKVKSDNSKKKSEVQKKKIIKKLNPRLSNLRQMSLTESFLNQSARRLRSRNAVKNYLEDTTLSEKYLSHEKQNSVVLVKKLNLNKHKLPVYKSVPLENSDKNKLEIYDFQFDINDSKERIKKKKKRTAKRVVAKKKRKKFNIKSTVEEKIIDQKDPVTIKPAQEKNNVPKTAEKEPLEVDSIRDISNNDLHIISIEPVDRPENTQPNISDTFIKTASLQTNNPKPTIRSVERFDNRKVLITNDPSTLNKEGNTAKLGPINSLSSKLAIKNKLASNCSFFEKPLSPIMKSTEIFDPSSPWRSPASLTFSQVQNFYQSTPQNKYMIPTRRVIGKSEFKNLENATKIKEMRQRNNENSYYSPEKSLNISNSKKNNSVSGRKFGTEITNLDHSVPSNNTVNETNEMERIVVEAEDTLPNVQSSVKTDSNPTTTVIDNNKDKKNAVLNLQTPKKVAKRRLKKLLSRSPLKASLRIHTMDSQKENMDPIPGPSGLQNHSPLNENRVLRQSNLNNFLNVAEVPQSTSIITPHGIFDDTNFSSVPGKRTKKLETTNTEIQNAFGFSDDDSNQDVPSTKVPRNNKNDKNVKPSKNKVKLQLVAPVRVSIGQIKSVLPPKKADTKEERFNEKATTTSIVDEKTKAQIDIQNFSDTFDIFSETGEVVPDRSNVPLFVDYEPSHFTGPPRHSYKRTRPARFSFSDGSCDEMETTHEKTPKRRKLGKLKKADEKRLREWVKTVNQTFEEIDQYDLLVE